MTHTDQENTDYDKNPIYIKRLKTSYGNGVDQNQITTNLQYV